MSRTVYPLQWSIGIHDADSGDFTDPLIATLPTYVDRETTAVNALAEVMEAAGTAFIQAHPGIYDTHVGLV